MFLFTIDRESKKSLTQQVYENIRNGILSKELSEGEKLSSTRQLAEQIGVSRNIAVEAYEQLVAEGYLEVRPSAGTYVSQGSSLPIVHTKVYAPFQEVEKKKNTCINFQSRNMAMDYFPRAKWGRLAKDICSEVPEDVFGYSGSEGTKELRTVLSRYLLRARGVRCHPEQIVITSGATQGLHLITELLSNRSDYIAVEDPVTDEMRTIFSYAGANILPIPIDEKGILPDQLPSDKKPSFVFVIPSHQAPLGVTLPIQRRIQLIEYTRKMDCYIVEDDYDSEFTYEGSPVHSIQGLDPERVIYVGTFSKILSPALRIGYVVLPTPLIERFRTLKWFTDRHTSTLEQLVLARFIEDGHFDRHVRRVKKVYRDRRAALVSCIQEHFPNANILGQAAGMHLVVEMPNVKFTEDLNNWLKKVGVLVYPVERYALNKGFHESKIVMGYGGLTEEKIRIGVARLKAGLESYKQKKYGSEKNG
ncbi:PLP-dependent aminotransferase family protein [Bacillus sp. 03113]|uniref:MocR-like pyridoxine biosynthesis transcription factor PdxR n=1 Tax=Bacillus sp. 03113 TaxID=2578211 RepID=UPI0011426AAB|nr:PLP-dependent aminotransferase family protein [Bacillus sp. 03113]